MGQHRRGGRDYITVGTSIDGEDVEGVKMGRVGGILAETKTAAWACRI